MSYADVVEGLHSRFGSLNTIQAILDYEPTAVQTLPTMYSLLDKVSRQYDGGSVVRITYYILHRLLFRWQDYEQAEEDLIPYVNSIPAAVDKDPQLGGLLVGGESAITAVDAVFVSIGGTIYRALDFTSESIELCPLGQG